MTYFDEKDWEFAKGILKREYFYMLRSKWHSLGQSEERMLKFFEEEREGFRARQVLKKKKR